MPMGKALKWNKAGYSVRDGFFLKKKTILDNIDLELEKGAVLGLIGPNGAGKTTTLKLAAGLLSPSKGDVLINGIRATSPESRSRIGMVTENQYIYPHLRLSEWLKLMAQLSGMAGGDRAIRSINEKIDLFGLASCLEKLMKHLSKGQLQRAGLAQAFLHNPDILILDEPMSGLDPYWRKRVLDLIVGFKGKGGAVVVSSHIVNDIERIADNVAVLKNGKISWLGNVCSLINSVNKYEVVFSLADRELIRKTGCVDVMEVGDNQYTASIANRDIQEFMKFVAGGEILLYSLTGDHNSFEREVYCSLGENNGGLV